MVYQATSSATTAAEAAEKQDKICVVYDIGGRGDLSFNDMAYLGAIGASEYFGLRVVEV